LRRSSRGAVFLVLAWLLVIGIRLSILWRVHENPDLQTWRSVFGVLDQHGTLYDHPRYNHAPLWAAVSFVVGRVARGFGWPFVSSLCAFLNLVDLAIAGLVWKITRARRDRRVAAATALVTFANPLSVIASSFLGQFDNIAIAFLLGALALSSSSGTVGLGVSGLLGASLIAKHVAWFHPLLFFRGTGKRVWLAVLPYALFLASFVPFWRSWRSIRDHVFLYRSGAETYGLEALRESGWLPGESATVVFVVIMLTSVWLLRRVELVRAALLLFLVQLIVMPGVWPYYFVWPVALGALFPSAGYLVYTLVLAAFFFKSPDVVGLDWPHLPGWWGCWWAAVFWLLWEVRALRSGRPGRSPASPGLEASIRPI
jgi:hypothetical protein